jgi:hypothetical protein
VLAGATYSPAGMPGVKGIQDQALAGANSLSSGIMGFGGIMSWPTSAAVAVGSPFFYMHNAARFPGSIGKQIRRFQAQARTQFKRFIMEYHNQLVLALKILNAMTTVFLVVMAFFTGGATLILIPFFNAAFMLIISIIEILYLKFKGDELIDKAKRQVENARIIAAVMDNQAERMNALADLIEQKNATLDRLIAEGRKRRDQITQELFSDQGGRANLPLAAALGVAATAPYFFSVTDKHKLLRFAYSAGMVAASAAVALKSRDIPEDMKQYIACKKSSPEKYCLDRYVEKQMAVFAPELQDIPALQAEVDAVLMDAQNILVKSKEPMEEIEGYMKEFRGDVAKVKISMASTGDISDVISDVRGKKDYDDDVEDKDAIRELVIELRKTKDPARRTEIIERIEWLQERMVRRHEKTAKLVGAVSQAEALLKAAATMDPAQIATTAGGIVADRANLSPQNKGAVISGMKALMTGDVTSAAKASAVLAMQKVEMDPMQKALLVSAAKAAAGKGAKAAQKQFSSLSGISPRAKVKELLDTYPLSNQEGKRRICKRINSIVVNCPAPALHNLCGIGA